MWFLVATIGVVAIVVAWYASWTARRLDRLHARVDAAAAALQAQLLRRSATVDEFAATVGLPAGTSAGLVGVARAAAAVPGLGHDREVVENAITRGLLAAITASPECFATATDAATAMHDEALRATFGRHFYNDTVRDALVVRDRRVVRWFRLAGRAPHPAYFEMDDAELPVSRISVASAPTMER